MWSHVLAVDIASVHSNTPKGRVVQTLIWGEPVILLEEQEEFIRVLYRQRSERPDGSVLQSDEIGLIAREKGQALDQLVVPIDQDRVLKVHFVDVQQGDACLIETPKGRRVLVDSGQNQLFARYLAARYHGSSAMRPEIFDAVIVTHGDEDHLKGFVEFQRSESYNPVAKRLFASAKRVFHSGIVKRQGKDLPDLQLLGPTAKVDKETWVTDLVEDPRERRATANPPFQEWCDTLDLWQQRYPEMEVVRLDVQREQALNFLEDEGIHFEVLGPTTQMLAGAPALRFLHDPDTKGHSVSHTINGHSLTLRLQLGEVRFLLTGDINAETAQELANTRKAQLEAEVLKVPHHGSHDYSADFLAKVRPLVSVVSSGDETAMREHVHPRANLVAALGKAGRTDGSLVFITELSAFFKTMGQVGYPYHEPVETPPPKEDRLVADLEGKRHFFAFKREAFGMIRVHTDGHRLLVVADSGKTNLKESYAFLIGPGGTVEVTPVIKA